MAYNPASEAKFTFEILDFDYDLSVVGFDVTYNPLGVRHLYFASVSKHRRKPS